LQFGEVSISHFPAQGSVSVWPRIAGLWLSYPSISPAAQMNLPKNGAFGMFSSRHRNREFTHNRIFQAFVSLYAVQRMGRKEQPVYASKRQIFVFGIVIVAALIAVYSWQRYFRSKRAGWPSARVSLSEFRTIPIQVLEGQRGSAVVYQAEAHVGYVVEGKQYRLWLPILSRSDSQQLLQFELSLLRNTSCYVHWDQAQPDNAFLTCDRGKLLP